MNIVILVPALTIGGGEVFAVRLANALSSRHQVTLVDLKPEERDTLILERILPAVTLVSGDMPLNPIELFLWKLFIKTTLLIPFLHVRLTYFMNLYKARKFASFLRRYIDNNNIDVVNSHMAYADWHAFQYFKQKNSRGKFIISMHGCYNRTDTHLSYQVKHRYEDNKQAFNLADYVVVLTPKNLKPLQGVKLQKDPVFIPLGIDNPVIKEVRFRSEQYVTFGLVSRSIARKGWKEAIECVVDLNSEGFPCRIVLVGDGECKEQLMARYQNESCVIFAGSSSNVYDWIRIFDVGLFTSYIESESFPNAVAEYLSCGKPVIATDIGEVRNMMSTEDGKLAGSLLDYFENQISVGQLKQFMKAYLQSPALLKTHQQLAENAGNKFDMTNCMEAYESLYSNKIFDTLYQKNK